MEDCWSVAAEARESCSRERMSVSPPDQREYKFICPDGNRRGFPPLEVRDKQLADGNLALRWPNLKLKQAKGIP